MGLDRHESLWLVTVVALKRKKLGCPLYSQKGNIYFHENEDFGTGFEPGE
jgi:hypothetical protein